MFLKFYFKAINQNFFRINLLDLLNKYLKFIKMHINSKLIYLANKNLKNFCIVTNLIKKIIFTIKLNFTEFIFSKQKL